MSRLYQRLLVRVIAFCLALTAFSGILPTALAGNGTLLMLLNPTNSSPRPISLWGGAGSEQIILKSDGTVWDWGFNGQGELGNNTTNNAAAPVQVLGPNGAGFLTNIVAIMGGEAHNFALKSDGTVWSWGWNVFGQLGDGSTNWGGATNRSITPVQVSGLTSVRSLGGRGYHSLALKTDGTIWAWGDNADGELGNGVAYSGTNNPVQVINLTKPASISGGGFFSLALMSNGTVYAWGEGNHGECGNGFNTNCWSPVQVSGLTNVAAISGGWFHSLALQSNGTVWAWGDNQFGEIGDNTISNRYSPVQVIGLSNIVAVSSGDGNSLARGADGTIWKWGENQYGELGIGSSDTGNHPLAVQVPGLSNVVLSACRDYHNICIKNDGSVWVWGDNRWGGCGDFTGNNVVSPRLMPGLGTNNLIPGADPFESYPAGFNLVGTNYWSSDNPAAAVVNATNDNYAGLLPVPGPHLQMLQVNGTVTNSFCPSFLTNIWADMIVQTSPMTSPPPTLTNVSFAICVNSNGQFAVWNCTNPPAPGNGWTTLLDAPPATNQLLRLTIGVNYAPDANGIFYYNVWINGVASTNPAARYAAADFSQPWFGQIAASGNFLLDDLVVGTNKTFYALQTTITGYGGSVTPAGPMIVNPGSTNTFDLTASNWYYLASVSVDGANIGTPASYTFTNVQADHNLAANYAPFLAASNTPEWWLYQINTNWATNFDAAALADADNDGQPTWQEYIAGTDPTNTLSVFALSVALTNGQTLVSIPTIPTTLQYQSQRYYALDTSIALLPASWQPVTGYTSILGSGQTVLYTNSAGTPSNLFFRARVWLGP